MEAIPCIITWRQERMDRFQLPQHTEEAQQASVRHRTTTDEQDLEDLDEHADVDDE